MANAGAICQSVKQPFGRFPCAPIRRDGKCKGPGGRRGLCGGNYPPGWGKPGDQTKKEESPSVVGAAQGLVNMYLLRLSRGGRALEIGPRGALRESGAQTGKRR